MKYQRCRSLGCKPTKIRTFALNIGSGNTKDYIGSGNTKDYIGSGNFQKKKSEKNVNLSSHTGIR